MHPHNALLVGISGPSSSGKTTLARLLRDIYPNVFILHEDDFYKPDGEVPVNEQLKVQDWDCLESVNLLAFEEALSHIRTHGTTPPNLTSKEDKNAVGSVIVDKEVFDDLSWRSSRWMSADVPPIAIIDGFLLYSNEMKPIRDLFDVKLFLRTDFTTAKQRRAARSGYVTRDGFWKDPPHYVDNVVWPNYVRDHAFLFEGRNVDGELDQALLKDLHINGMPKELQGDMNAVLQWAYQCIESALEKMSG